MTLRRPEMRSMKSNGKCASSLSTPFKRMRTAMLLSHGSIWMSLAVVEKDATLLVAGEGAVGKRTDFEEYRLQSRGGKGIITMKTTDKTGLVVGALTVKDSDEI